jgi:hypothetical protein
MLATVDSIRFQIYVFSNVQSQTTRYTSRSGKTFRLMYTIIRLSVEESFKKTMTAVRKEIYSFTKYVIEIY